MNTQKKNWEYTLENTFPSSEKKILEKENNNFIKWIFESK